MVVWPEPAHAWQRAFELGWEAFRAGSNPVGAVVVAPSGEIVAVGRSRAFEDTAPSGQLAGTYLAHAEVNALLQLPRGEYWDHTLYTTLEPCLLCPAALTHTHVGAVRYAASDTLWAGIDRLPELNEHVRKRWPVREHAETGVLEQWASLLSVVVATEHGRSHTAGASPHVLSIGRALAASGELRRLRAMPVSDAIALMMDRLAAPEQPPR